MDQYRDKCFYLEQDLSSKLKENEFMKKDIEKYEVDYLTGKGDKGDLSNTALRIESEQLRKDNQKLLEMLKGTKEYAEFGNFVEDSGGNAIRIPSNNKENQAEN
tara:strand:- start:949 stop:1260 length:312 start_codon:yes stop_codon:yes gene_type:complete